MPLTISVLPNMVSLLNHENIMATEYNSLHEAVFERFTNPEATWKSLSLRYNITISKIRIAYTTWITEAPESQPESFKDIHFKHRSPGRPCALALHHEHVIADAIRYYADNSTPLNKQGVSNLIKQHIDMLLSTEEEKIPFSGNYSSRKYCENLMARHRLETRSVRQVEDNRIEALTKEHIAEHIALVQAAMNRFNTHYPNLIFNMDQSGSSFGKIIGRSLRKGVGRQGQVLLQKTTRTKGDLTRLTIMPVVSASGKSYTPCVIYPGKKPHYRKVDGKCQTLHDVLMDCHLHHRDPPGADSAIVYDWAKAFVDETENLRRKNQHLLLLLDGYSAHLQFKTLDLFRRNNVVTIALPSHTSHKLQPLDVTVFGPFKSYLQRELHVASQTMKTFNAFDIGAMLHNAYARAFVAPNIIAGFLKCGVWDPEKGGTNVRQLDRLFRKGTQNGALKLEHLLEEYNAKQRSLLRDAIVEEAGRIAINTRAGAHITSEVVVNALQEREVQRKRLLQQSKLKQREVERDESAYKEPAPDIRRLVSLADVRAERRKRLREPRLSSFATKGSSCL